MVSSSEQVSVETLPGRHSVALQIDAQRTGLKHLLLVSHRQMHAPTQTNSCSNSSSGGRTFHTVHWLGTGHMGGGEFRVRDSEAVLYATSHTLF